MKSFGRVVIESDDIRVGGHVADGGSPEGGGGRLRLPPTVAYDNPNAATASRLPKLRSRSRSQSRLVGSCPEGRHPPHAATRPLVDDCLECPNPGAAAATDTRGVVVLASGGERLEGGSASVLVVSRTLLSGASGTAPYRGGHPPSPGL